jgi:hypothetical protein
MSDPDTWTVLVPVVATVTAGVARVVRMHIMARRDVRLAELALRDTEPAERGPILEKLAGLRPFKVGRPTG